MMGDEFLPKHIPGKYQRLVIVSGIYNAVAETILTNSERIQNLYSLPDDGRRASPET